MNQNQVKELIQKYNIEIAALLCVPVKELIIDTNWRASRIHGRCMQHRIEGWTKIQISNSLVKDQDIKEVILHELCHAYCDAGVHHGPKWQELARRIGDHYNVRITRCSNREHVGDKGPIAQVVCPCCGSTTNLYKRGKIYHQYKNYFCRKCSKEKTMGKLKLIKLR